MIRRLGGALAAVLILAPVAATATTKGLNQIVTPDIQPAGVLSLSVQAQDAGIGNPLQVQYELGLTRRLEIAAFQGLQPGQTLVHFEFALADKRPWLLSVGELNWDPKSGGAQPFIEPGYYKDRSEWILGAQRIGAETEIIAGAAWLQNAHLQWQTDWLTGPENYLTFGITYYATPAFSINPALYLSNTSAHIARGYIVASWNTQLW